MVEIAPIACRDCTKMSSVIILFGIRKKYTIPVAPAFSHFLGLLLMNLEGRGITMTIRPEDSSDIKNPRPAIGWWPNMRLKIF